VYTAAGGGGEEAAAMQAWQQHEQSFQAQQEQRRKAGAANVRVPWMGPPPLPPRLPAREACPVCSSPISMECVHVAMCDQGHTFRRCPHTLVVQLLHMRDRGAMCGSQCIALPVLGVR
jgi:hypothetical protein